MFEGARAGAMSEGDGRPSTASRRDQALGADATASSGMIHAQKVQAAAREPPEQLDGVAGAGEPDLDDILGQVGQFP
jgi:hypothetical protein